MLGRGARRLGGGVELGRGKRVGLGEQELAMGRVLGWVKFLGFGLVRGGFQVWGLFFYLYSISKTNQTHLNSNWNLNSNHTQSIKSMHQHECTNMLTLK